MKDIEEFLCLGEAQNSKALDDVICSLGSELFFILLELYVETRAIVIANFYIAHYINK